MDNKTIDKFQELEHDIEQLNCYVELTFLSNQCSNITEFLKALHNFLKNKNLCVKVNFAYLNIHNILQNLDVEGVEVNIDTVENDLLADFRNCTAENNFYLVNAEKNHRIPNIIVKYNLQSLFPYAFRLFAKENEVYLLCTLSVNENCDENVVTNDLTYLNRIFNFVEPILYKYIKKQKEDVEIKNLHKTLSQISILYSISQAVNFIDDLRRLLEIVLSKALETIDAERASLMFYDYADNSLQIKYVFGLEDKNIESDINNGLVSCTKIKVNEGVAGKVFAQKKSIICNLGQNDPRFQHSHSIAQVDTLLCVPLIAKGEAIGVINISNKRGGNLFTKNDLDFMEALANQAAIAIDNSKLYEMATRDGLTKLYIYRHFYTLLENEIRRAERYEHLVSFLMIDIDNFKSVNDTYGHLVGDQVLKEVASTISYSVRKVDNAARYGGEEFAIILPETSCDFARKIANRIRDNVSKIVINLPNGSVIKPTISVGLAEYPTCAEDEMTLIELADIALYQAKASGKNVVFEYTPFGCNIVDKTIGLNEI